MAKAGAVWVDVLPNLATFNTALKSGMSVSLAGQGRDAGESFTQSLLRTVKGGMAPLAASVEAQAKAAADAAAAAVDAASAKVALARRKEADAAGTVRVAEQKLQELREKGNASASQLVAAEERLARAQRAETAAADGTVAATKRLETAQTTAAEATTAVGAESTVASGKFARFGSAVNGGAEKMTSKIGGLAKGVASMGGLFAGFELAKFAGESLHAAQDFQKGSNVLVTAAGESTKNLASVRKGLTEISSKTGTSLDQMTEGMYTVEKAGYHGAAGLKIMDAAAKGAKDEGADLGVVTNALTSIMYTSNGKITNSAKAMNALMTAAGHSKTTLQDFASSLSSVLPVSSKLGIGFDQISGALGTMTASGMSAQQASQNLNHVITALAAPNRVAADEMSAFGVSAENVRDNLGKRGLQGTIDLLSNAIKGKLGPSATKMLDDMQKLPGPARDLFKQFQNGTLTLIQYGSKVDKLKGLSQKQKDEMVAAVPAARGYAQSMKNMTGGIVGLNTSMMLTGKSSASFSEKTKDVGKALNSTDDFTKKWGMTQKTASTSLSIATQTMKNAGMVVMTNLLPAITQAAQAFAKATTAVVNFTGKNWSWIGPTAKAIGAFVAALISIRLAQKAVNQVTSAYKGLKSVASGVKSAVQGVGSGVSKGISGGKKAVDTLKSSFDTLRLRSMYAKDAMKSGWDKGVTQLKSLGSAAKSGASSMLEMGKNAAKSALSMAKAGLAAAGNAIKFVAMKGAQLAVAAAQKVWAATQWALNAAMDANPITLVILAIAALGVAVVVLWKKFPPFRQAVEAAWNGIKAAAKAVVDWFTNTAWPAIKSFLKTMTDAFTTSVSVLSDGWKKIRGYFSDAIDWITGFFSRHWKLILGILTGPIGSAALLIYGHWSTIKGYFSSAWSWASGTFKRLWNGVEQVFTNPIDSAKRAISTLLGATGLQKVFHGAISAVTRIWNGLKSAMSSPINAVIRVINNPFISGMNKIIGAIPGVKLHIPTIPTIGKARGGILPGSSRYHEGDDQLVPMRRGEGVYVSEAMRDPYERARLHAVNAAAMRGQSLAPMQSGFAGGGILGSIGSGISDIGGAIKNGVTGAWSAAKQVAEIITDPAKAVGPLISHLLGGIGKSFPAQLAVGAMKSVGSGLVNVVKNAIGFGGGGHSGSLPLGSAGSAGMGWQWMWNVIHSKFPGVDLTSAYRPGAIVAGSGQQSMHAIGRAIDIGGSVPELKTVARWIAANYGSGSRTQLLYTPAFGNMGIYDGHWYPQPGVTVAEHGNHVHWGYASGTQSAVPGVANVAENGAELVLSPQLRNFKGGERVLTAAQTSRALGGEQNVTVQMTVDVAELESIRTLEDFLQRVGTHTRMMNGVRFA